MRVHEARDHKFLWCCKEYEKWAEVSLQGLYLDYSAALDKENYEKVQRWNRQWYWDNREQYLETVRRYKETNPEAVRESERRSYEKNAEKRKAYQKKYKAENPEACLERKRLWRRNNPEKVRAQYRRRRAQKYSAEREPYSEADLNQLWYEQGGCCAYCAVPLFAYYHVDHVIPLSRGGADRLENLALACPSCNVRKSAMTAEEFMERRKLS